MLWVQFIFTSLWPVISGGQTKFKVEKATHKVCNYITYTVFCRNVISLLNLSLSGWCT